MTGDELKRAMFRGEPVTHRGFTYSYISALIYRKSETGTFMQVELVDPNKNCVVIAAPAEVELAEAEGVEAS